MSGVIKQHRLRWKYCREVFKSPYFTMLAKAQLEIARAEAKAERRRGEWKWIYGNDISA